MKTTRSYLSRFRPQDMASNIQADAKQRLSRSNVECFQIRIAECAVGHHVFGDGDNAELLSCRRYDVYACFGCPALCRRIRRIEPRGHVEIPPAVQTHPIPAATHTKIVNDTAFSGRAIGFQFISVDLARSSRVIIGCPQRRASFGQARRRSRSAVRGHRLCERPFHPDQCGTQPPYPAPFPSGCRSVDQ